MPNDLTPNNWPAKQITPVLSPELKSQLDSDGNSTWAITNTPDLRAEAQAMLPVLKAAAFQPAGQDGIREVIGRRFATYPQPARSDGEWAAWWSDYYDTLQGVGWAALEAGMSAWVADPTSEFMPKPGKLLELTRITPNRAAKNYTRAKRAVEMEPDPVERIMPPDGPERPAPGPDDVAKVKAMLAGFKTIVGARPVAVNTPLPAIHGKADEGGLTPAMRELMAKRGEA